MNPYVLVTGDIVQTGGMDAANYALASYLARSGVELHLVAYRVAQELAAYPNVVVHRVAKPANAYMLGSPLLSAAGLLQSRRLARRDACVITNGGNCPARGINWVHYVHAAYAQRSAVAGWRRWAHAFDRPVNLARERKALRRARLVIANSEQTRRQVIELVGVAPERVRTVYYGIDPSRFHPLSDEQRSARRNSLGWQKTQRLKVAFVGALGDRRKGFDVAFDAWRILCQSSAWDADLVVIGAGAELPEWRRRAADAGLAERMQFLGFRTDVPSILPACDALVAPTRYEAYGLGVHEALCSGVPAIVSASSGVAERYTTPLEALLLKNPESTSELVDKLMSWRARTSELRAEVARLGSGLRARTWDIMAKDMAQLCVSST